MLTSFEFAQCGGHAVRSRPLIGLFVGIILLVRRSSFPGCPTGRNAIPALERVKDSGVFREILRYGLRKALAYKSIAVRVGAAPSSVRETLRRLGVPGFLIRWATMSAMHGVGSGSL